MTDSKVLVATWSGGLFAFSGETREGGKGNQELANHSVRGLAADGRGGALAIIDAHALCRRASDGAWSTIATAEFDLACCVAVGNVIYVGTDDARVLRVSANGKIDPLRGFDEVAGRDTWFAGSAIVNGKRVGPPLGVRSITATADGAVLLANVHVGGIPRSVDGGETWQPTIEIAHDVHEVRAHPHHSRTVAAAAAVGLCISSDGGATWTAERAGLHAPHCSAVAFAGNDVLVSASVDPFVPEGAVYRRKMDEHSPLVKLGGGLPEWLGGKVDTGCMATNGSTVAMADMSGSLYVSSDAGLTWSRWDDGIPMPSGVLIV